MAHNQKKAAIGDVNSAIRFLQTAVERLEQGEEKILQSAPPTNKQSTKLKPSLCRCANCEAVQSLNNIFCSRCGMRF